MESVSKRDILRGLGNALLEMGQPEEGLLYLKASLAEKPKRREGSGRSFSKHGTRAVVTAEQRQCRNSQRRWSCIPPQAPVLEGT